VLGPLLNICLSALPTMPIAVSPAGAVLDINTDVGASLCDPGITNYCVVAGTGITHRDRRQDPRARLATTRARRARRV
jgi:hypothetical protein